jgi:hypothetical protein
MPAKFFNFLTFFYLKGMFKVYPVDENLSNFHDYLIFKNVQPMNKEECIVRVYIVRGIDLQPKDSNGKVTYLFKLDLYSLK